MTINRDDYRVIIKPDREFRQSDLDPELQGEYTIAYELTVEHRTYGVRGKTRWNYVDSLCGILLDTTGWLGEFTLDALDEQSPGPDANHLNEIVNEILKDAGHE